MTSAERRDRLSSLINVLRSSESLDRVMWLVIALQMAATLIVTFDRLLPAVGIQLAGDPSNTALAVWHTWWPQYKYHLPDGLVINSYSGAPFLANHLLYMPIAQSAVFALFNLAGNPVLAFNLVLILSALLTQFWITRYLASKGAPILVAGTAAAAFVLSPPYYQRLAQADVIGAAMWMLPVTFLLWDQWCERPQVIRLVAVVGMLYLSLLSGLQHLAWITGLWLPYAGWTGWQGWKARDQQHDGEETNPLPEQLLGAILLLSILVSVYPGAALTRTLYGFEPAGTAASAIPVPSGQSMVSNLLSSFPAVLPIFVGVVLAARTTHKQTVLWIVLSGACLAFGLGIAPDPLTMLAQALNYPALRLYNRNMFYGPALFAMVTHIGLHWSDVEGQIKKPWLKWGVVGGLCLLIVGLSPALQTRYPFFAPRGLTLYSELAAEPEDFVILDYPAGILSLQDGRKLGGPADSFMYAAWHEKRTVNGVFMYSPPDLFSAMRSISFLTPQRLSPGQLKPAAEDLARAVQEWRIGYVIVHADTLSPEEYEATILLIDTSAALCPPRKVEGLLVYRARWNPRGCQE